MSKGRSAKQLTRLARIALPSAVARQMFDFQFHIEASQWWPSARIARFQKEHLSNLLTHAYQHVPIYRERLDKVGLRPGTDMSWKQWRDLPVLRRDQLQDEADALRASNLPPGHEQTHSLRSSGSTGRAVEVKSTNVSGLWQSVLNLRCQLWAARDFSRTMGVIRKLSPGEAQPPDGDILERWGGADLFPFATGCCVRLAVTADTATQLAWIERRRPDYLTTYPSVLRELASAPPKSTEPFPIKGVSTLGENVDQELRDSVVRHWNCRIFDCYSAEEVGCIAIECPQGGGYHVQAEALVVEVLRPNGEPCRPGEVGELVMTPLYNYAMPLLRYALGDYAEVGEPCGCGRGLPFLKRIVGRQRNMLALGDGRTFWPTFGTRGFARIAPIIQQQFHQTAYDRLEVRLVVRQPLNGLQESALKEKIQQALPVPFHIDFIYVSEIPKNAGGKFETFTSAVAVARQGLTAMTSA